LLHEFDLVFFDISPVRPCRSNNVARTAVHRAGALPLGAGALPRLQASEQYLTSFQFLAQALRQLIARPQCSQGLVGSAALLPLKPWRATLTRSP
jgi:hypothetical protein